MTAEHEQEAQEERRLGLLILENKSGPALMGGAAHLRKAAELWKSCDQQGRSAECLNDLGRLYRKCNDLQAARDSFREAWRLFESMDDLTASWDAAFGAGEAALDLGEVSDAVRFLERACELADELNEHMRIADSRLAMSRVQTLRGQYDDAIAAAKLAFDRYSDYRQGTKEVRALRQLATTCNAARRYDEAANYFEQAAERCLDLGRWSEASTILSTCADMQSRRGEHQQALGILERCLELQKRAGDKDLQAQTWRLMGATMIGQGDIDSAFSAFDRSEDLCLMIDDQVGAIKARYAKANALFKLDRMEEALNELNTCLERAKEAGNDKLRERILSAVAKIHKERDDSGAALAIMHDWVETLDRMGDHKERRRVLGNIADLHRQRGNMQEAEKQLRQLLDDEDVPPDDPQRLYAEHNLGVVLAQAGRHQEAVEHFSNALTGYRKRHSPPYSQDILALLSDLHYRIGASFLQAGQLEDAKDQLEASFDLHHEQDRPSALARVLVAMGHMHGARGEEADARRCFMQAQRLCEEQGDLRNTRIIRRATDAMESGGHRVFRPQTEA